MIKVNYYICCIFIAVNILLAHPIENTSDICSDVINTFKSLGRTVRDCTQLNNGHVYWRIEDLLTWTEAQTACRSYPNADLTSIHNFDEKALLNSLAENYLWNPSGDSCMLTAAIWIGLYRKDFTCSEPWVWSDNSAVDYTDFLTSQPDCSYNVEFCTNVARANSPSNTSLSGNTIGWNDSGCDCIQKSVCKL